MRMWPLLDTSWKDRIRRIVFSPIEDHAPTITLSTTSPTTAGRRTGFSAKTTAVMR